MEDGENTTSDQCAFPPTPLAALLLWWWWCPALSRSSPPQKDKNKGANERKRERVDRGHRQSGWEGKGKREAFLPFGTLI